MARASGSVPSGTAADAPAASAAADRTAESGSGGCGKVRGPDTGSSGLQGGGCSEVVLGEPLGGARLVRGGPPPPPRLHPHQQPVPRLLRPHQPRLPQPSLGGCIFATAPSFANYHLIVRFGWWATVRTGAGAHQTRAEFTGKSKHRATHTSHRSPPNVRSLLQIYLRSYLKHRRQYWTSVVAARICRQ